MNNVTLGMVLEARERLRKVARHTDLVHSRTLSNPEREVYLKAECLQHTGSFKLRGAYNMISQLTKEQRELGVIAASAGNHAQGVALAAQRFGVKSTIVMPEGAPLAKIAATRDMGGDVVLSGAVFDDAYNKALEIQKQTGAILVHAFNDPLVIAGQGTMALEILDDLPDVNNVLIPIGGGGLAAGMALAIKELNPEVRVIGVEAAGADAMLRSIEAGTLIKLDSARTIADGIAVKSPGELTLSLCRKYLDDIVTVEEDEIANAILLLLERCKMVSEGAGAAAAAAAISGRLALKGKTVCVVSGGNIDVTTLQIIIDRGLVKQGRIGKIETLVIDRPGQLQKLLAVLAQAGANIMSIQHDRVDSMTGVGMARLSLMVETNNREHFMSVVSALRENEYVIID